MLNSIKPVKIIGSYLSPYVRKVLVVLELKNIPYEIDPINPFLGNDKFLTLSPLKRIPIYIEEDNNFILTDSTVICEYLNEKYPENSLLPLNIKDKAKARWLEEYSDTRLGEVFIWHYYQELFIKKIIWKEPPNQIRVKKAEEVEIPDILNYLEQQLPNNTNNNNSNNNNNQNHFIFGDKPTMADISITSFFRNLTFVGYHVDEKKWPVTTSFLSRTLQLPAFQKLMTYENAIMQSNVTDRRRILKELGAPLTSETLQTLTTPRRGIMDI